jgi:Rrf2 family protein
MKIATRARYALRLMIDIASNMAQGGPVKLRDVARRQRISKRYLEQLVMTQKNADLVSALSGRGGGYSLTKRPEDIQVGEVIAASIGAINVVGCVERPEICPRSADCPSRVMWCRVNEKINGVFDSVTLADLLELPETVATCHGSGHPPPCSRQEGVSV